jgi:hypothetical protein
MTDKRLKQRSDIQISYEMNHFPPKLREIIAYLKIKNQKSQIVFYVFSILDMVFIHSDLT